jgi:hypothetical protein
MFTKIHDGIEYVYTFERFEQEHIAIHGQTKWRVQFLVSRAEDNVPVWTHDETGEGCFPHLLSEVFKVLEDKEENLED